MTPMLEKALQAARNSVPAMPGQPLVLHDAMCEMVETAARAALLAIREPDRVIILAIDDELMRTGSRPGLWAAGVDAILGEAS